MLAGLLWLGSHVNVAAATIDADRRQSFLSAIAEVETGGNARAVGSHGERGMYQFSRATWRLHTKRGFMQAHDPVVSHNVAVLHYDWIHDELVRSGCAPTQFLMAAAWNAGVGKAISGRIPNVSRDYARRVINLAATRSPQTPEPTGNVKPAILIASQP